MNVTSKLAAEMIRPISEMSKEVSHKLSESMKPIFTSLQKLSTELGRAFKQYGINECVAMKLLKKYKLFLSPSMDVRLVSDFARIGGKSGNHRVEINRLLVWYFTGNNCAELAGLMNSWEGNELFRPRTRILRDCLMALRDVRKDYNPSNVVLPALIAQIDGIRQCYLEKKGYSYKRVKTKNGKWRYEWLDSNGQIEGWKDVYKLTAAGDKYMAAACEVFLKFLFGHSERGKPAIITFNRHKIMHGENTRYGRIDNTIRAFLILDFLYYLK